MKFKMQDFAGQVTKMHQKCIFFWKIFLKKLHKILDAAV